MRRGTGDPTSRGWPIHRHPRQRGPDRLQHSEYREPTRRDQDAGARKGRDTRGRFAQPQAAAMPLVHKRKDCPATWRQGQAAALSTTQPSPARLSRRRSTFDAGKQNDSLKRETQLKIAIAESSGPGGTRAPRSPLRNRPPYAGGRLPKPKAKATVGAITADNGASNRYFAMTRQPLKGKAAP